MKILAAPSAGLGHRIHNIDASIFFARHVNAEIRILWYRNHHLNCSFFDLFEPIDSVEVIETSRWDEYLGIQETFSATKIYDTQFFSEVRPNSGYWNAGNFACDDRVIIKSWHRFFSTPWGTTNFVPTEAIARTVKNNEHLSKGAVGIHVRRTDHNYAIKVSPSEEFFNFLDARPKEETFFLCTDSEEEREQFERRYSGRLQFYSSRSSDRKEPLSIQDAFVEMLLLAKCKAIVASDGSLFSSSAAYFGRCFLHRIKI